MKPYIVVTGCGSSGTKFAATAFQHIGLNVQHERKGGTDGLSSWYVGAGPEGIFKPRETGLKYRLPPFGAATWRSFPDRCVILHQTRNPLKVISTVQRYSKPSWQFIYRCLPDFISPEQPVILRCMNYWYWWNLLVEEHAAPDYRYRVEDFLVEWPKICELIERPELKGRQLAIQQVPKTVNTRKSRYKPLSWKQLSKQDAGLTKKIRELGREYGYNV